MTDVCITVTPHEERSHEVVMRCLWKGKDGWLRLRWRSCVRCGRMTSRVRRRRMAVVKPESMAQ